MPSENVIPLLEGNPNALKNASREELIELYTHYCSMTNELLRRAIINQNRVDLLATMILGYQVTPMHLSLMRYQFLHPKSLQLAFRGAGKSTVCTVTKTIHYLLKDPNLRVCLASKSSGNAEGFLKE